MDELALLRNVYHLNEAHGVSSVFYLYKKFGNVEDVKKRLVFTTHTPEEAGNEKHDIYLCQKMSYFCGIRLDEVRKLTGITDDQFNHSLVALRFAQIANGVSQLAWRSIKSNVGQVYRNLSDYFHHQCTELAILVR